MLYYIIYYIILLGGDTIKIAGKKQGYVIHKISNNNYCLCKILREYNSEEDAKQDLIKLLARTKKEEELNQ